MIRWMAAALVAGLCVLTTSKEGEILVLFLDALRTLKRNFGLLSILCDSIV